MILKSTCSYINIVVKPSRCSFPQKVAKREAVTQCTNTMYIAEIHEPPRKRVSPGKSENSQQLERCTKPSNAIAIIECKASLKLKSQNPEKGAYLCHFREVVEVQVDEESCSLLVDNLEFQFEQNFPQLNRNQCLS